MNCDQMLNVVTEMGRILLQNGAEIHRVEESMQRICLAYGLADSGVFAISTCIHVSFQDETGRNYSRIKRIRIRGSIWIGWRGPTLSAGRSVRTRRRWARWSGG